jgi:hypothetical protein
MRKREAGFYSGIALIMAGVLVLVSLPLQAPSSTETSRETSTLTPACQGSTVVQKGSDGYPNCLTSSTNSLGLDVLLVLNSTKLVTGDALNVTAAVQNSSPKEVDASEAFVWAFPSIRDWQTILGGCPSFLSIQVYSGHYAMSNLSTASPLQISNPGRMAPCGPPVALEKEAYFRFQPSSHKAAYLFPSSSYTGPGYPMSQTVEAKGYYPSNQSQNFIRFPAGSYTVAAGDEWGQLTISYFSVSAT